MTRKLINLQDADMFWDYLAQNPEAFHQVCSHLLLVERSLTAAHKGYDLVR